jgi:hypothetical protein
MITNTVRAFDEVRHDHMMPEVSQRAARERAADRELSAAEQARREDQRRTQEEREIELRHEALLEESRRAHFLGTGEL